MTLPRIQPIAPTWHKEPVDDPDWLFDLNYDGFRELTYIDPGRNRLISRNRHTFDRFDGLSASNCRNGDPDRTTGTSSPNAAAESRDGREKPIIDRVAEPVVVDDRVGGFDPLRSAG